ncbi:MAG: hypothetical protein N2235_15600, partial [Fischerella sp.]|nr:hypothetical protein [Fischerella sp.]
VNPNRSPQPRILLPDPACDHFTYFTHPAGLEALAKALFWAPLPFPMTEDFQPQPEAVTINAEKLSDRPNAAEAIFTPSDATGDRIPDTAPSPPETTNQPTENRPRINGALWIIALLLVTIAGLLIWNRSQEPKPGTQQKNSQVFPIQRRGVKV